MRIVIDTNVLVSGMLWHGSPHTHLTHVRDGATTLFTSRALMDELAVVLDRDKFGATLTRAQTTRENVLAKLRQLAVVIEPQPLPAPVCRDPDDDQVIACAIAARANTIVSGDRDLLDLRQFRGIPIMRVHDALEFVASR